MKLLLDENLPKKLKLHLVAHEVYTVRDKGWNGVKNGELLKLLIHDKFDCLLTFDKSISYQQNFQKYPICVLVLYAVDNEYDTLKLLMGKVESVLEHPLAPGPIQITE